MIPVVTLNWWGILAATVAYFLLGGIWYSPTLFGPAWARSLGMNPKTMKRPTGFAAVRLYLTAFIISFILVLVLSILIHVFNASSITDAMQIGIMVWLGFVATEKMTNVLFEGRNAKYFIITSMYSFVGILVAAAFIATWF